MEGPAATNNADEEYMTMDADQWVEQDDIYENGDTLDLSATSGLRGAEPGPVFRGKKKEELKNERVATNAAPQNNPYQTAAPASAHPSALRYITIRRPPFNAKGGQDKKQTHELALFRRTTLCLAVLCVLLIAVLLSLSIACAGLAGSNLQMAERGDKLLKENYNLTKQLDNLRNVSMGVYHVSSNTYPGCLSGRTLFILNYEVLEEIMTECAFYLYKSRTDGGGCNSSFSWRCSSNFH